MNKIVLIRNLGNDPDMIYIAGGVAITTFRFAIHHRSKSDSGEWQDETNWFNIVTFRQLAEICNTHLKKGHKVSVAGRIQQHKYIDIN